jgi:hypothetical protein
MISFIYLLLASEVKLTDENKSKYVFPIVTSFCSASLAILKNKLHRSGQIILREQITKTK